MKVSVITVVRNAVDKIESTLLSVLGQDYASIEYIVVDGGSSDGTLDVIHRYRDQISVVVSEPDEGIYDAINKGVMLATGDWIGIMNAGDSFAAKDTLSQIFGSDGKICGCDVVYGNAIGVDGDVELPVDGAEDITALETGPCYRHGASFVRRETHSRYLFDLSLKPLLGFALDYEQIYRMYRAGVVFRKVALPVIRYELRGASTVSPFKCTYYNYLITHGMKCGLVMRGVLFWLTLWRGVKAVIGRFVARRRK